MLNFNNAKIFYFTNDDFFLSKELLGYVIIANQCLKNKNLHQKISLNCL